MKVIILICFIFFLSNPLFSQKKGRPDNIVGLFYDHVPSSGFDTFLLGFNGKFLLNKGLTGKWSWSIKTFHQRTETNGYFPEELYDLGTNLSYIGKDWLFVSGINSYSDKPFASKDDISFFGLVAYNVLNSKKHFLYLGAMYLWPFIDPIGNYPLPIIAYTYKSKNFFLSLPFPFIVRWKINKMFTFLIMPTDMSTGFTTKAAFKYTMSRGVSLDLEAAYISNSIFYSRRTDKSQELKWRYAKTGVRFNAYFVSAFVGYAFAGEYYYGKSFVNTKTSNVDIKDSITFDLSLKYGF